MTKAQYDSPWKNILTHFLEAFMMLCLPDAAKEIDWTRGYTSLDKELRAMSRQQAVGKRIADVLFQVWLKTGEEAWVLLHIEVQAQKEEDFCLRMYTYNYRAFDRYQKPVMSVAVLVDNNPNWRPTCYTRTLWDNKLHFEFSTVKLLDYANKKPSLTQQNNPFAIVIWAHLSALETKKNKTQRFQSKLAITRALYEHGFSKDYIIHLFAFIDWVLALPELLAIEYVHKLEQIEEEKQVNYITSVERIGIQKGEAAIVMKLLKHRFGSVPHDYEERIVKADADKLLSMGEKILDAKTLEDVFAQEEIE